MRRVHLRSLASDTIVYGLSDAVSRMLTVFLVPIYTRLFTPTDYGVLSLVNSSLGVLSVFIGLGLDNSAHRWYWDTTDDQDRRRTIATWAWSQLATAFVVGLAIFFAADWAARAIVHRPEAAKYFRLSALTIPIAVLTRVVTGWMRMRRRPWSTAFYSFGTSLVTILLTALFVIALRWGLTGVYAGQLIATAAAAIAAILLLRSWISPVWFDWNRVAPMLRFSWPMIPGALAYWVVAAADRYFVDAYTNTAEVGLYSVGYAVASLVALATMAFQMAWGPFAFSIHKEEGARQTYASAFLVYLWGAVALSAGISLFAPEAIRIVAPNSYNGAASVVGMLALSYVMIGLTYIAATGPAIAKRTGPTGLAMAGAAVLNILLCFLLVPSYGKNGAAIATFISQTLTPAYLFYRSQQIYPIPYRFRWGFAIVAVGILVMAAGSRIELGSLWLNIGAKLTLMLTFAPLPFLMQLVTPAQLRQVLSVRRRAQPQPASGDTGV